LGSALADVVLDVELLVVLQNSWRRCGRPVGVLEERRRDLIDVAHLLEHLAGVVAARTLRLLEQLQPADVHGHVAVLGEQEADRGGIDGSGHRAPSVGRVAGDPPAR
jgi:hypothetical protein